MRRNSKTGLILGILALAAVAAWLAYLLLLSESPAPVSPQISTPTRPTATLSAAAPSSPTASFFPTVVPGPAQPTAIVAPTATSALKTDGTCNFDRTVTLAHLKPEHLSALHPAFRQSPVLPAAPALYQLEVSLNPAEASYSGALNLTFWNQAPQAMARVVLRTYPEFFQSLGGQLSLSDPTLNGKTAGLETLAPTYVALQPAAPLPGCSKILLSLKFSGKIPARLNQEDYAIGTFYASPGFFALGTFYPQLALWEKLPGKTGWDWTISPPRASSDLTAAEAAYYDVRLQTPSGYQVIASGQPVETGPAAAGLKTWRFVGGPFREFAAVGSENFSGNIISGSSAGGVAVKVYTLNTTDAGLAARQQDFARKARDITIATLDEFGAALGPYPYTQYSLVQFPLSGFNGIEWPMFSQFSVEMFQRDYRLQEQELGGLYYSKPGTLVIVHEVLHQWWYNLAGNDQQREPFLDEGLAEYCAYLLPELRARSRNESPEAARAFGQSWLERLRDRVKNQDLPDFGDQKVNAPASDYNLEVAGFVYYRKAPLFYDAFRQKFGDKALFDFLRIYFQREEYRLAHYPDLLDALALSVPGRENEVRDFANRWLNEKQLAADLKP